MIPDPDRYVYILSSNSRVLYTGITRDLQRRVYQHKTAARPGYTKEYAITRLVYFECTSHIRAAIKREREIKSRRRGKKIELIEITNPGWFDLALDWFPGLRGQDPSLRSG